MLVRHTTIIGSGLIIISKPVIVLSILGVPEAMIMSVRWLKLLVCLIFIRVDLLNLGDYMTTQYANASYQEVIDLHTESDKVSVIGLHTPNSDTPYHFLKGFWNQFRKFRYNGCSVSLVPAARLPADPLAVSYDAAEPTIDPRDLLNPILFHGCHGDDMGAILNQLYLTANLGNTIDRMASDSADLNIFGGPGSLVGNDMVEALYYKALTDKTWLKAHPMKGFRKSGLHPMLYSLASTVQFGPVANGSSNWHFYKGTLQHDDSDGSSVELTSGTMGVYDATNPVNVGYGLGRDNFDSTNLVEQMPLNKSNIAFYTPRLQRLGWMDTRQVVGASAALTSEALNGNAEHDSKVISDMYVKANAATSPVMVPKIYMGMIMLPPAYKTEQYFRLVINHSFSFAKFRGASMDYSSVGMVKEAYSTFNFNDVDESKKVDPDGTDDKN